MVLTHAVLGREKEGAIGVMAGIVDIVNQRRALVGSGGFKAVASSAIRLEKHLPASPESGELWLVHIDNVALRPFGGPQRLPHRDAKPSDQHGKNQVFPRGSLQIPPGAVSQIPPPARQDKVIVSLPLFHGQELQRPL